MKIGLIHFIALLLVSSIFAGCAGEGSSSSLEPDPIINEEDPASGDDPSDPAAPAETPEPADEPGTSDPGDPQDPPTTDDPPADDPVARSGTDITDDGSYNYAAALQKALVFYDAERSGDLPEDFRVSWRGDAELCDYAIALTETNLSSSSITQYVDPDGDEHIDLGGGFHDAGDHVKFGLPQAYTASTLGWALYEFEDAFRNTDQYESMLSVLTWFSDYFLKSTFLDSNGNVIAFGYQVGEGDIDHQYWGPPEVQSCDDYPRPAHLATATSPASDQSAGAAAALALMFLNSQDSNTTYANTCLTTAKSLYRFAKTYRGLGYSGGFYNSSDDNDELAWAALWLYVATGETSYLTEITSQSDGTYTGYLSKIMSSTSSSWSNSWTHSWDTIWTGVILKLAQLTGDTKFKSIARWNLDYWSGLPHESTSDQTYLGTTPAGYAFLTIWGSARYNTTAQFMALLYDTYFGETRFRDWAKGQMAYLMGQNPLGRSYIVGFTGAYAEHPHHRAAHASLTNSMNDPETHRHILYGALVGGPDDADYHNDQTSDYIYNEVAIDYNAGFVGALAGLYTMFGTSNHLPILNFPPQEDDVAPLFVTATLGQDTSQRTEVTLILTNESFFPPEALNGLSVRYFFSIEELKAYGQSINDVRVDIYYDQSAAIYGEPASISALTHWKDDIYYVEIGWTSYEIFGDRKIQFAVIASQASDHTYHWNPSNDWSHQSLSTTATQTPYIPIYRNGTLVAGTEP